jgi:DEAD/DEAH box helicase domain-containing protein
MFTEERIGFVPLDLPPYEFKTAAFWFTLEKDIIKKLGLDLNEITGGIHGIEHAHIVLLPLYAGCDRWDLGGMSTPIHPDTEKTTIFIYDGYDGGIGFAERGFDVFEQQIFQTLSTISSCPCVAGCPGCIVSPKCGNNNEPLDKRAALKLLKSHLRQVV